MGSSANDQEIGSQLVSALAAFYFEKTKKSFISFIKRHTVSCVPVVLPLPTLSFPNTTPTKP